MRRTLPGFTLIEVLLSVAILGVMAVCLVMLIQLGAQNRIRMQVMMEVDQQGQQIVQLLSQTLRNADAVTSPATSTSGSSLSLLVQVATSSPTVFDLSGNALRITEGATSPIVLTNGRVMASGFTVQNLARTGTPGTVRYQFMLTAASSSTRAEYIYARTYTGSASLRQP